MCLSKMWMCSCMCNACKGVSVLTSQSARHTAAGLWVDVWTQLLRDITADPISQQRVMVDILNEPDSRGLACTRWPSH